MGIFGAGNAGAAVTKFVAPSLVVTYGWQAVPKVYAAAMAVTVVLFWLFTYSPIPEHKVGEHVTFRDQMACPQGHPGLEILPVLFHRLRRLRGPVLWMTKYYISEYGFGIQTAA
jgi:MFS transporter, NNP family, nitrate/nitrite transporter